MRRGSALVSPFEAGKGRTANPLAREFHAFVRSFFRDNVKCLTNFSTEVARLRDRG